MGISLHDWEWDYFPGQRPLGSFLSPGSSDSPSGHLPSTHVPLWPSFFFPCDERSTFHTGKDLNNFRTPVHTVVFHYFITADMPSDSRSPESPADLLSCEEAVASR